MQGLLSPRTVEMMGRSTRPTRCLAPRGRLRPEHARHVIPSRATRSCRRAAWLERCVRRASGSIEEDRRRADDSDTEQRDPRRLEAVMCAPLVERQRFGTNWLRRGVPSGPASSIGAPSIFCSLARPPLIHIAIGPRVGRPGRAKSDVARCGQGLDRDR
jgi:hypothetical protein